MSELAMVNHYGSPYYPDPSQPTMTIITYDPPEIRIVPQYSKMMVASVDPYDYSTRYSDDLLDTEAILEYCRRLGIPDHVIEIPSMENFS